MSVPQRVISFRKRKASSKQYQSYKLMTSDALGLEIIRLNKLLDDTKLAEGKRKAKITKLQSELIEKRAIEASTTSQPPDIIGFVFVYAGIFSSILIFAHLTLPILIKIIFTSALFLILRFTHRRITFFANTKKRHPNLLNDINELETKIKALQKNNRRTSLSYVADIEEARLAQKKARNKERSARLAAYEGNSRLGSQSLKKKMRDMIVLNSILCPYCENETNKNDLVLDHIYPVAKGGLTTPENTILICQHCNSKKQALTLYAFCKKVGLGFDDLVIRLEKLGKFT